MPNNTVEMGSNQYIQIYQGSNTSVAPKKKTPRKNPWGSSSYADLITQAIETSPEKKLTLSQIYDWMIRNVPHFSNQGSSNSSAGWKNSIRHNLSLHERFFRLKGEETSGKSSWWTVNKAAGIGRTTRRKSTGKKRAKNQSSPHKSLSKKLSDSNATTCYFSSSTNNGSFQNLPNFPNSSNRKPCARSSTSSEDNESVQSIGSNYSPSFNDSEMIYRETFQNNQAISKKCFEQHPAHTFSCEYNSASDNTTCLLIPDTCNNSTSNSNGLDVYYQSFNKLYPQHDNQLNLSYDYSLKSTSTEDTFERNLSTISAEYFKSPHHLSGSYMTSEVSRIDSTYNTSSVLDKPDAFLITDLSSHTVHESSNVIETFDSNQNNVLLSHESQNFIKMPFVSDYHLEANNNMTLNDLNQRYCKSEAGIIMGKDAAIIATSDERLQNNSKLYYKEPREIKSELLSEEETENFSDLTKLQENQESENLSSPTYFGNHTTDHEYLDQISGYIAEQDCVENAVNTQIKTEIEDENRVNNFIKLQPNTNGYQKQYSQQKIEKCAIYKPKQLILKNDSEQQQLSKSNNSENSTDNQTTSHISTTGKEIALQVTLDSNENILEHPPGNEKYYVLDSCNKQKIKYVNKRKYGEKNECSTDNLKRSKLDYSQKMLDSGDNELNYRARRNETKTTGKTIFHQHLNFITYRMVKSVMLHIENLELTKSVINSTFALLHALSLQISQKKFLVVLTELLFTLKLSYKCHDENGVVMYSNYNSFFEDLLFSHLGYEVDFNSVVCIYVNALDAFISEDFAEKILEESMRKYKDNLPNIVRYLKLYLTETSVIDNFTDGNLVTNLDEVNSLKSCENFVPSSVHYRKSIHEVCVEIKIMENRKDNYVNHIDYFIRRRFLENDIKVHPSFCYPSLNILQNFLDAIKLQPKYKLLSSDLVAALVETAKMTITKNDILNESLSHNKPTIKTVKFLNNVDILPNDLNDIQLSHNFELENDLRNIDFDFSDYDSSYDKYL